MDRRHFISTGLQAAVAVGAYASGIGRSTMFGGSNERTMLVAVKGGMPDVMFDRGIDALGGMKAFVKKGQRVVVKPNIGWDVPPENGGNTNPKLIARVIEHCTNAGAKEVVVLDHTCDEWQRCYTRSGIEAAAKAAGAKVVPAHSESYYHEVTIKNGKALTSAKEHEAILAADVFINVPILKDHSGSTLTISMKNLMGNVWDRHYWHGNDLHQCIADFATYRRPTLNIVDAYVVMKSNGPRGISTSDLVTMKTQLLSTDLVAIDTAAAKLCSIEPKEIRYINLAAQQQVGTMDLSKLSIKRITV